ncbi:MAG TPA: hypothetical protein VIX63_14470 [Vicinamibacterales bacterium]
MPPRQRLAMVLAVVMTGADARAAAALEMRVGEVRAAAARVAATLELSDLLRDRFLDLVQQGNSIFLQLQAELWEDRRIADRLALTTPALTYRIAGDGGVGMIITSQSGDRVTHTDLRVPVPVRVDVGPVSVLADDRAYYLRAQVTLATIADRDIDEFGTAIFGDPQSAAGLASLGRFVFGTLLRIGKYLESASADATSPRYTGLQIKSGK